VRLIAAHVEHQLQKSESESELTDNAIYDPALTFTAVIQKTGEVAPSRTTIGQSQTFNSMSKIAAKFRPQIAFMKI
jgi:hypothetical protein